MTSEMPITDYLAGGGKLSAPDNAPPLYRAELMRMMSSFIDSELAGSAGFAGAINWAPGIKERIAASRIVLEKAEHADRILDLMSDFGTDKALYNSAHHWAARLDRDAAIDPGRHGGDMRLSVFHYPFVSWSDAVVMNVLMGLASTIHLQEMSEASYTPFAEAIRAIQPREKQHMALGLDGLNKIATDDTGRKAIAPSVAYWFARVADTFGPAGSGRFDRLRRFGLRHNPNEVLRAQWAGEACRLLEGHGLKAPADA